MMKSLNRIAFTLCCILTCSQSSDAAIISNVNTSPGVGFQSFSSADSGTIDFNIDMFFNSSLGDTTFDVTRTASESVELALNGILNNFSNTPLQRFQLFLSEGAFFSDLGRVQAFDGTVGSVSGIGTSALTIDFSQPLSGQGGSLEFGSFQDPQVDFLNDFFVDTSAVADGTFGVQASVTAVPEPSSLAALAVVMGAAQYRRSRRKRAAMNQLN